MKKVFLFLLILLSTNAFASGEYCFFNGEKINLGNSVWVEVPEYKESIALQMKKEGYSKAGIEQELKTSDHTGHRLYCRRAYSISNKQGKSANEILKVISYVMIDINPYSALNK